VVEAGHHRDGTHDPLTDPQPRAHQRLPGLLRAWHAVYVDGVFRGCTYFGSPVGFVAQLRPGTPYRLAVQGRDNCTGATSPLSEPLRVTTLR
jgi:hypothetical protein